MPSGRVAKALSAEAASRRRPCPWCIFSRGLLRRREEYRCAGPLCVPGRCTVHGRSTKRLAASAALHSGTSYARARRAYRRCQCDPSRGPCQPGVRRVALHLSVGRCPLGNVRRRRTTAPSLWPGRCIVHPLAPSSHRRAGAPQSLGSVAASTANSRSPGRTRRRPRPSRQHPESRGESRHR